MQYVKKPIPIHAQQIVEHTQIEPWLLPYLESGELTTNLPGVYQMKTKHGLVQAERGDWILQAADGEIYPCSDEVFQATYVPAPEPVKIQLWRHRKRGSVYHLIGFGRLQADGLFQWSEGAGGWVSADMAEMALYRAAEDGSLWARLKSEFEDGRFEAIEA